MRSDVISGIVATEGYFWRSTCVMHLIVWGGIHFCLWRILEHLACMSLQSFVAGLLLTNQIILSRGGVCLRDSHSAVRANWTCSFCSIGWWSSPSCLVWIQCVALDNATLGDSPENVHNDLVVLLERLRVIELEVNGGKCALTIPNDSVPEATEALFRGLLPVARVVEACDLSLLGASVDIQGIPGTIHEKSEALAKMTSKLKVLNQHQAFVLLKNAFAIPKLQYVLRASPAYLGREELELRIFNRALFDSLGKVANVSLKGDVCKQAGLPVIFGGLNWL